MMRGPRGAPSLLSTLLLVAANILIPVSVLVYATGFFPYKPLLSGLAQYDVPKYGAPPPAPFDRVVFMVVDALRSDFVYAEKSGFQYTQSLIRDGGAIPFTAHATSPTVTMPRLKAITTGSIPSFLDVILNIDEGDESSSLASQDTWLAQMKAKEAGRLVFYGDDTWLKLFPGVFDRADGTSSFFVADFTEVDNNVTRHITDELRHDDWNTLVLHYLGLDHIGHKGGPRSSNMIPKQREMDGIVKEIYNAMETYDHLGSALLVLCGDHGMNDGGNHGGSSAGETSPALVFLSPKMKTLSRSFTAPTGFRDDFQYYSVVEQSDLAPTLGALLGFPAPKNNLGAMIVDFLPFWQQRDQVQILMSNAGQILDIITAAFGRELFETVQTPEACRNPSGDVQELACRWHGIRKASKGVGGGDQADLWVATMSEWLRDAQSLMSSMASNYDMPRMYLGQVAALASVVCALLSVYLSFGEIPQASVPFALITLTYGVMMFASSYVEEEHHFWYWSTTAWLAYVSFRGLKSTGRPTMGQFLSVVAAFVATRIIRAWNQTGQKFAGGPDIVKTLLQPYPLLIWVLLCLAYLWLHRELVRGFDGLPAVLSISVSTGLALAGFTFKLAFTSEDAPELVIGFAQVMAAMTEGVPLVARAQAVFIGLGLGVACVAYCLAAGARVSKQASAVETIHHLCTLLAMTQSRATNIPLFFLFDLLYKFLAAQAGHLSAVELATTALLLQHASFFALGGTNAISSVDLSSAYNGVSGFNVAAVAALTFVGNWAAPIYWATATASLLERGARGGGEAWPGAYVRHVAVLTVFVAASVASVMAACTALRTHLFIWTVFSPKYLYCMAWALGQHLVVNVAVGGLLVWVASIEKV